MNDMRSPGIDTEIISDLKAKLESGNEAAQLKAIAELGQVSDRGAEVLLEFLLERQATDREVTCLDGKAYQTLRQLDSAKVREALQTHFSKGVVSLNSASGIDYEPLQQMLIQQDFEAADRLTSQKMCEAAGSAAVARGWLYFTEVAQINNADLNTINLLWLVYSEGKFGFSVQRKMWLGLGKNWEKLWLQIGWKKDGKFTRYPGGFIWSMDAPKGHLPLSNQIRGNKTIAAIFAHPLW
ncbi:GUN4 domain-containing protein [Pseudanabaena sp. PCC 6802]|uniref:GUN4 domain-containing protein n=1 Tax=Pseudanabaena sp. PCC 6802 TaxID=118173 RepID=UPI0003457CBF|nr:GUN4 domain-containing protein [Pseudanabaena sp. PCC 6802]